MNPSIVTQAVDFQTAYLADKYDVDAQSSVERANDRIRESTQKAFSSTTADYTSVIPEYSSVRLLDGQSRYALYPVWIRNTRWQGKPYIFSMNGQTGKMAGDLPMDKSAYRKWLLGITGAVSGVLFALSYLLWML